MTNPNLEQEIRAILVEFNNKVPTQYMGNYNGTISKLLSILTASNRELLERVYDKSFDMPRRGGDHKDAAVADAVAAIEVELIKLRGGKNG